MIEKVTTIRDYRPGDKDQFLDLARTLQTFEVELYDRMMPVEDVGEWYIAALLQRCAQEDGWLLVAESDGALAGFAAIFTRVEQHGEIDEVAFTHAHLSHIAVRPDARGGGVGKLLMAECERRARAAGRKWLRLGVLAANPQARSLYQRLGFRDHLVIMKSPWLEAQTGATKYPADCRAIECRARFLVPGAFPFPGSHDRDGTSDTSGMMD